MRASTTLTPGTRVRVSLIDFHVGNLCIDTRHFDRQKVYEENQNGFPFTFVRVSKAGLPVVRYGEKFETSVSWNLWAEPQGF